MVWLKVSTNEDTICFSVLSVSSDSCPSFRMVFSRSCWDERMCSRKDFSKAVTSDGSSLSRWPRTPAYMTATCSSIAIGTGREREREKEEENDNDIIIKNV